ncbi:MAG: putative toxin-antitoxin system toxin component, PIN family [Calditrichaeota bacterium]|nr:MAG: putative toxin-antitoxin system toxin component, PIN family [Calditrichota bacterium]
MSGHFVKVVLDSNVIVAAFATRGLCHSLFELCLERYTVIISTQILNEVNEALRKKIKTPEQTIFQIMEFLKEFCLLKDYEPLNRNVCRDKHDDHILALGKSNGAKYIITGDTDLLMLKEFESIKIVSPREFWEAAKEDTTLI